MNKLNVCTAIGKGRPSSARLQSRIFISRLHECPLLREEEESNNPPIRKLAASRADRLRSASNEVQSLFNSSSAKNNPNNPRQRSPSRAPGAVTAPSSLKERLKQRAAQRTGQTGSPGFGGQRSGGVRRTPSQQTGVRRLGRDGGSASSGSNARPERRKKSSRPSRAQNTSNDEEFIGHEYNDPYPDNRNVALLEQVLAIQQERVEKKLPAPTQHSELSEEEQDLEAVMKTRAVRPDLDTVLANPTGLHNEVLGSGLGSEDHVYRLMALARAKSRNRWVSPNPSEVRDVDALAQHLRKKKGEESHWGVLKAISNKWVDGQYQPIPQDASDAINNALRGISINKSYTSQDSSAFMQQFNQIIGSSNPQPRG